MEIISNPAINKEGTKGFINRVFHSSLGKFRKYHHLLLILVFRIACICVVLWILLQTSYNFLLVPSLIIKGYKIFDMCSFYNVREL